MIVLKGGSVLKGGEWTSRMIVLRDGAIERVLDPADPEAKRFESAPDARVYDATGQYIFPGAIDMHVHFRFPGGEQKEDWAHATAAAYAGGVTYVCDMPNNTPPMTTVTALEEKIADIETQFPKAISRGFYMAATEHNLAEIIAADAASLICGVKVYYGTSTGDLTMNNPDALRKLMLASLNVPIVIHAEDDRVIEANATQHKTENDPAMHSVIRSREAATQALSDILDIVRETGATNVHITHITTAEEVALIAKAKAEGLVITCDVTPHHLVLTTADYKTAGNNIKVNPPIREQQDIEALWKGLNDDTIDMVASDHAPHTAQEKQAENYWDVPSGVPGVQTLLPVLIDAALQGHITWQRVQELVCRNPVSRFHLIGRGMIHEGAVSDLVVIDPQATTTVANESQKSLCGWTPFAGRAFKGSITATFANNDLFEYTEQHQVDLSK